MDLETPIWADDSDDLVPGPLDEEDDDAEDDEEDEDDEFDDEEDEGEDEEEEPSLMMKRTMVDLF